MKKHYLINMYLIIVFACMLIIGGCSKTPTGNVVAGDGDKVKLDFYVMSQCPYGTEVEDAVKPVLDKIGGYVDFSLNFIAKETADGKFQSKHGMNEVYGDMVQLCAAKHELKKYMSMVVCMNENAGDIPNNWKECAEKNDLDTDDIEECLNGEEGKKLLSESIKKSDAVNAQGSPTIYINNEPYQGGRDSDSFMRAVCSKLSAKGTMLEECKDIPACSMDFDCTQKEDKDVRCVNPGKKDAECVYSNPVAFKVKVITDDKCKNCDTKAVIETTKNLFKGAQVETIDADTEEGKELIRKNKITLLPSYLFESAVETSYSWEVSPKLKTAFEKIDFGYKLLDAATGAAYFVDEKARKEFYDAIGVTLNDNKPQIDFFVMSYCPYGNIAEEAIYEVYKLLKDKDDFNPHYVIYGDGKDCYEEGNEKYCSMHGGQELHQNVRELCVKQEYGTDDWFKFAIAMNTKCNYQNADTCWEGVASGLNYDTAKIKACEKENGIKFSKAEKVLGDKFGASGSPQVFVDGAEHNSGRTPEAYKQSLCSAFETMPEECSVKLEGSSASSAAQPQGNCG